MRTVRRAVARFPSVVAVAVGADLVEAIITSYRSRGGVDAFVIFEALTVVVMETFFPEIGERHRQMVTSNTVRNFPH